MTDLVERQAVIDAIHLFFTEEIDKIPTKKTEDGEVYVIHKCQPLFEMNKAICKRIKALPSVPTVQAIPIEVLKEIRQEITNEAYTKQCFDSDMYDYEDKAIDLDDVYAIIDEHIKQIKGNDPE